MNVTTYCGTWQRFAKVVLSPCGDITSRWMTILDAVPPEGLEITVGQFRLAPLSFTHWNSSRFLESFNYVMHCWRWNCSCPNFFWNVLQVWMTGKDVYLQMTWSWPDKTWNILCSYCLQWNTSQSKFRNHYFLFLFAFSILSQLFLIWAVHKSFK